MANIHPSAVIEDGANIADDAVIGQSVFVSSKSVIGSKVVLMQGAGIYGETSIGEGTIISPYAILGNDPQDVSYTPKDAGKLIVGKNNKIREFCTINTGTKKGDGYTRIGDDCVIMAYCHVAHDCLIGSHVILANNATLAGHVEIDDFTVVGGLTPIHQFVKIGEGCMIGGASAVTQDIPPFCLAEGNRAVVKGLNSIGLKRRFEREDIKALQGAYRKLFRSGKPLQDVAKELIEDETNEKVLQMCSFIKETSRGIPYNREKQND